MKASQWHDDWTTVGSWRVGVLLALLLGMPFALYLLRYLLA